MLVGTPPAVGGFTVEQKLPTRLLFGHSQLISGLRNGKQRQE